MPKTKATRSASAPAPGAPVLLQPLPHPPLWFRFLRWTCFSATVGLAIGVLALMNQQLNGISWMYDGKLAQYLGRDIRIQYCMLSSSTDVENRIRCNFAFAVASVSLVLSFMWSYLQALRRNPFKNPGTKLADVAVCGTWLMFWLAAAVILCVWADQANKAGSFLASGRHARNGLCVMAWLEFLLVAVLAATGGLLFSPKCQSVFDKWEDKHKQKEFTAEQKRLQGQQAMAAQQEAAAAAAVKHKPATASVQQPPVSPTPTQGRPTATHAGGASGVQAATAAGPAAEAGRPAAAGAGAGTVDSGSAVSAVGREEAPVSQAQASSRVEGQPGRPAVPGADDNPFR